MRYLTVKRRKSFVGSAAKMKIYIEDWDCGELIINDVPCSLLGSLKNGEEKSFEIDEQAAKIYVIGDKLMRNHNEYYQIYPGYADVYISGKNYYNPNMGNPFQFDNNENSVTMQTRKRLKRKGIRRFFLFILIGVLLGIPIGLIKGGVIRLSPPEPEIFSTQGISITLSDEFIDVTLANEDYFDVMYSSRDVAVLMHRFEFSQMEEPEAVSMEDFLLSIDFGPEIELFGPYTNGDLYWFEYELFNPNINEDFFFATFYYKGYDSFWEVQFGLPARLAEEYSELIFQWAGSVSFGL